VSIRIRVVTPITSHGFRCPGDARALSSEGVSVDFSSIDVGPASIECAYEIALAAPATIARIVEAERDGIHAVVIDCMGDPGLSAARERVSMPVLGPMQTSMNVAAMLGYRFSVVTVLPRIRPMAAEQAAIYGLSGKLASVRAIDIPVLELENDLAATKAALVGEAELAVRQDSADAIIFGCTGLFGCAEAVRAGLLARGIDIPVIDPIPTTVAVASALVHARLAHSKTAYPPPPAKRVVGYQHIGIGADLAQAAE
jgi:allantoin racemase